MAIVVTNTVSKNNIGNKKNNSINKNNNSNNKNNSSSTNAPSQSIKTNTSYNGSFLTINTNTDYTKLMNDAAAKGDYTSAAKYEAMRNAKVNYLNSTGDNRYSVTNNYVKDYGYTNNQGGQIFTNNQSSLSGLPDNWTKVNINGANYTRDKNGNIYEAGRVYDNGELDSLRLVGNGINSSTGAFTFNDYNDARNYAYDNYIRSVGLDKYGKDAYDYIESKGLVDKKYVDAIMNGTGAQYTQSVMDASQKDQDEYKKALAAQRSLYKPKDDDEDRNQREYTDYYTNTPIPQEQQAVLDANSFETDLNSASNSYMQDRIKNIMNARKSLI